MFDSPHTSAPMLMRGNALVFEKHLSKMPREPALRNTCHGPRTSLPQHAFHPTDHVQDIYPTDNPPPSELGWKGTTSSRTTTGAAPELSPPKSACAGDAVLMIMSFIFSCRKKTKISPMLYTPRVLPTIRGCLEGLALMM